MADRVPSALPALDALASRFPVPLGAGQPVPPGVLVSGMAISAFSASRSITLAGASLAGRLRMAMSAYLTPFRAASYFSAARMFRPYCVRS